jgi:hypothetical protein
MDTAFQPLIESARRARKIIDTELNRSAQTRARTSATARTAEERDAAATAKARIKAERAAADEAKNSAKARAALVQSEARKEVSATQEAEAAKTRIREASLRQQERAAFAHATRMRSLETRSNPATRGGRIDTGAIAGRARGMAVDGIMGAGGFVASRAVSLGSDVARGLGYQFDPSQHMANATELEKRSVDLSNAGYMPGRAGANGMRQDPAELRRQVQDVASFAAVDSNKAMEGLQAFVGKTGDLETGRALLKDMAVLSRATGTSMEDMVNAAGDVANGLGDTDNKAEKVAQVMRAVAAQGKEGAVEIKDLASQMAKVQAASGSFEGDGARMMAKMNAIAQVTRERGGAASATQAATSTLSFANTFSKGARLKAFAEMGVNVTGAGGKTRDPMEIIKDSLRAASSAKHGGMANFDLNMGRMFMDVRARSATRGFEQIYKEAGGGEAGIAAVARRMEELENATLSQTEVAESFARSMATSEAQSQLFNNEMQKLAGELQGALAPALRDLAPSIIAAAQAFAGAAAWLSGSNTNTNAPQVNGMNAGATLRGDMRDGKVSMANVRAGQSAEAELERTIATKRKLVEDTKRPGTLGRMGEVGLSGIAHPLSFDKKTLREYSEARETKHNAAKGDLARSEQELAQLRDLNRQVAEQLKGGVLKVEVVKEPARPSPLPGVDPAGRSRDPNNPER